MSNAVKGIRVDPETASDIERMSTVEKVEKGTDLFSSKNKWVYPDSPTVFEAAGGACI